MLLLSHMERGEVGASLQKDRRFVLNRSAALLAEMVNLAALPRQPAGYGWLAPAVGSVEFLQHIIQVRSLTSLARPANWQTTAYLANWQTPAKLVKAWHPMPERSPQRMQAVPLPARRNPGAHKGAVEGAAPLLQLPHLDLEVARKLTRKRVRGLPELQALPKAERRDVLAFAGLTEEQVFAFTFEEGCNQVVHVQRSLM